VRKPSTTVAMSFPRRRESSAVRGEDDGWTPACAGVTKRRAPGLRCWARVTKRRAPGLRSGPAPGGLSSLLSFPRKRESRVGRGQDDGWTPACAGVTKRRAPESRSGTGVTKRRAPGLRSGPAPGGLRSLSSFPRRRESRVGRGQGDGWTPACAGVTKRRAPGPRSTACPGTPSLLVVIPAKAGIQLSLGRVRRLEPVCAGVTKRRAPGLRCRAEVTKRRAPELRCGPR
jgi:hypothetical protein